MAVPAATVNQYYTGIFRQAPSAAVSTAYQQMPTANDALNSMLSAANLTVDPVVRLYQTAFNRVPDSAGLTAWVPFMTSSTNPAQSLQQIANGFAQSTEFLNLYPASLSNAQYVGALYWNILQRQGEDTGMAAWINALNNGSLTRAQVLVGFSNSPEFTIRIEPNVNNFLTNCANNTETYTGSLFDQGSGTVTSYALTTNVDTIITTTTGQNVVNGVVNNNTGSSASTLNPGDSIDGTKGTTTVSIVDTATAAQTLTGFTLNGVNTFKVQNNSTATAGNDQAFDLSGATGLANIAVVNSAPTLGTATNFNNVKNIVGASVANSNGNVAINYAASVVTGSTDTMSVSLNGVATAAGADSTINVDGIETFNITSSGTASGTSTGAGARVTLDGSALKVVNVAGSAGARITADYVADADGGASTRVATLNASAATGSLDLRLTTAGADIGNWVSVTGGAGNDTIRLNQLSTNATVSGGDGTDTLAVNSLAGGSNDFKNVTGFEALRFNNGANTAINLTNAGSISSVVFAAAAATGASLQGVNSNISTQLLAAGNDLIIDVTGAAGATADVVNVTVGSSTATTVLAAGTVSAANIETLNVSSLTRTGTVAGSHTITLTDAASSTLNISGNQALDVTMAAGVLSTVNASTATGSVNIAGIATAAFSATAASVTGGSGNDVLKDGDGNDLVTAGSGNDTVVSGAGNDTIDAGDGNDSIEAGTGNDSITSGAGNDAILFTAINTLSSGDTISGGDGTDTIRLSAGVTLADTAFKNVSGVETIAANSDNALDDISLTLGANANAAGFTTVSAFSSGGVVSGAGDVAVTAASTFTNSLTVYSGSGTDAINFGGTSGSVTVVTKDSWLSSADAITGGTSANDTVRIEANGGSANLTNVSGVETITVLANSTAPATKASTLVVGSDNTVVLGQALVVNASALTGSTSTFTFDGSAEVTTGSLAGRFSVTGGNAADTITGGAGNDTVLAGVGNDSVLGGAGNDLIDGGSGNNILYGGVGNDVITAGSGNDQIIGNAGADNLTGGAGNDLYSYITATDSLATGTTGTPVTSQGSMDIIDGFDAGGGTVATVADRIGSSRAVNQIGTVTIATASNTTLASALEGNATLAAALADSAYVVTVSAGTAAGTYLLLNGAGVGFVATTDTVVKLTNAVNLENLTTSNFTTVAPEAALTAVLAAGVYTLAGPANSVVDLNGLTGAVTDGGATVTATGDTYNKATVAQFNLSGVTGGLGSTVAIDNDNAALAAVIGTTGNDVFTYESADMGALTSYVNGNGGTDKVTFSTFGTATLYGSVGGGRQYMTDIDSVELTAGATALTVDSSVTSVIAFTNKSATDAAVIALGTGAAHTYTSGSSGADTVTLGLSGQSATFTENATNNVVLGAVAGSSVNLTGTGTNTLALGSAGTKVGSLDILQGNFTGTVAGTNTLSVTAGATATGNAVTTGTLTNIDTLALGAVSSSAGASTVTLGVTVGLTAVTGSTASKGLTLVASASQLSGLTTLEDTDGTNTFTVTASTAGALDFTGDTVGKVDVLNLAAGGNAVSVGGAQIAATGIASINGGAGVDSVTITAAGDVDLSTAPKIDNVETITLTGATAATDASGFKLTVNNTDNTGLATINAANLATGGTTIVAGNLATVGLSITGTAQADAITPSSVVATTITLGGGIDTVTLVSATLTPVGSQHVITDFTLGTGGDVIAGDTVSTVIRTASALTAAAVADLAAGAVIVQGASSGVTTAYIQTVLLGADVDDTLIAVFNTTTGRAEIWHDDAWATTADRTLVATLSNITTVGQMDNFVVGNFLLS